MSRLERGLGVALACSLLALGVAVGWLVADDDQAEPDEPVAVTFETTTTTPVTTVCVTRQTGGPLNPFTPDC